MFHLGMRSSSELLNCFYRHTRFMMVREEKLRHFYKRGHKMVLSLWCIYNILTQGGQILNLLLIVLLPKLWFYYYKTNMKKIEYQVFIIFYYWFLLRNIVRKIILNFQSYKVTPNPYLRFFWSNYLIASMMLLDSY